MALRKRVEKKWDSVLGWSFDLVNNVNTRQRVEPFEMVADPDLAIHARRYQATEVRDFKRLMSELKLNHGDYNFVDLGCGLGRLLIMAAQYPFKKIEGVEFASDLFQGCRENMQKNPLTKSLIYKNKLQISHQDFCSYVPQAGPNIFYLYNPCDTLILKRLAFNLVRYMKEEDLIVYLNPLRGHVFSGVGLREVQELPHRNHNKVYKIYQL